MKTRILLPALAALLLGGCAMNVTLVPAPADIHSGETSVATVTLRKDGNIPNKNYTVDMTSDDAAGKFNGTATTASLPISGVVGGGNGIATINVVGSPVQVSTPVQLRARWDPDGWGDESDYETITVHPAKAPSPANGEKYVVVAPRVSGSWTYEYHLTTHNSGTGSAPEIEYLHLQFAVKVTVSVTEAISTGGNAITVSATENANNRWYLAPGAGLKIQSLKVRVVASDAKNNGTTTFTCHGDDSHDYVATPIGPKP